MLRIQKKKIWALGFGFWVLGFGLWATKAWADTSPPIKMSLPFLVVDLDGTGIQITPLKDSKVYTDVDGDGMAEHTAWIRPNEGFLGVLTWYERQNLNKTAEKFISTYTQGIKKIKEYDKNNDGKYDEKDYRPYTYQHTIRQFQDLIFYIAKDNQLTGMPEAGRVNGVKCDFQSLDYNIDKDGNAAGVIHCSDKSYNFREVHFPYEDHHVIWSAMCSQIQSLHESDSYQKYCLDKKLDANKGSATP